MSRKLNSQLFENETLKSCSNGLIVQRLTTLQAVKRKRFQITRPMSPEAKTAMAQLMNEKMLHESHCTKTEAVDEVKNVPKLDRDDLLNNVNDIKTKDMGLHRATISGTEKLLIHRNPKRNPEHDRSRSKSCGAVRTPKRMDHNLCKWNDTASYKRITPCKSATCVVKASRPTAPSNVVKVTYQNRNELTILNNKGRVERLSETGNAWMKKSITSTTKQFQNSNGNCLRNIERVPHGGDQDRVRIKALIQSNTKRPKRVFDDSERDFRITPQVYDERFFTPQWPVLVVNDRMTERKSEYVVRQEVLKKCRDWLNKNF
ncbi:unnamed protein product [Owenia fusiformis]|uniref:Uncharacterized protein n=1 Tax=Owenia fusiformis TaxID=6347 RepID=A0A8J1ULP9_OWEFU|nr:unnamed protein product [Owenia fusiformis]